MFKGGNTSTLKEEYYENKNDKNKFDIVNGFADTFVNANDCWKRNG